MISTLFRSLAIAALILQIAEATKWKSLDYLYNISYKGVIAGVHNKISGTPTSFTNEVTQIAGKAPGMWSGDFLFDYNIQSRWTMTQEAKKQWESGALINIMWHACNPLVSEPCNWDHVCDPNSRQLSDSQWNELITDGTRLNNVWKTRMDDIAQYLVFLRDAGVEVMFRPFHEMNQPCFWWAGRPGASGSRRLYQITHDYLTNNKGLTNLIWTWNIQDFASLATDVVDYNPGAQYWEVVTLDVYGTDGTRYSERKYDIMKQVAGAKPFAIGECDVLPELSVLGNQPGWAFFMSWSELTTQNNSPSTIQSIYNSPQVITLNEMPGWQSNTSGGNPVANWSTCRQGVDTCSSGYTCCVAPADVSTGKTTCRTTNNCAVSGTSVANWSTCRQGVDTCSSGYTCCVAPADVSTGKTTCRTTNNCAVTGTSVANWNTCRQGVDICSSGYICCVAPADASSGKTTCRPSTGGQCIGRMRRQLM